MVLLTKAYDEYHEQILKKGSSWTGDTIFASLHTAQSFLSTHSVFADVSATEIAVSADYVAGGIAMSGQVISSASNITKFTSDALLFKTGGTVVVAADQVIIRNKTFNGNLLMLHIDLGGTQTSTTGGNWHITPDVTDGWARYGDTI